MRFTFFVVLLCTNFFCNGQILIKPKVGINICHLNRPPSGYYQQDNQVAKLGFQVGVAVELPLCDRLKLQPELLYSLKGLKDTTHIPSGRLGFNTDYRGYGFNFHYIEVPLLLRYSFSERVHFGIGPSIAYLLHVDNILDGKKSKSKSTFTKLDYSLNGDISCSICKIEIGARYNYGFRTTKYSGPYDPEFDIPINKSVGKNRCVQIYLGYTFTK